MLWIQSQWNVAPPGPEVPVCSKPSSVSKISLLCAITEDKLCRFASFLVFLLSCTQQWFIGSVGCHVYVMGTVSQNQVLLHLIPVYYHLCCSMKSHRGFPPHGSGQYCTGRSRRSAEPRRNVGAERSGTDMQSGQTSACSFYGWTFSHLPVLV